MSYQLVMTGDSQLLLVGANGELSLAVAHVEFNGEVSGYKDDFRSSNMLLLQLFLIVLMPPTNT